MNTQDLYHSISTNTLKFINQFTAESFNLCVIILLHCASLPTLLSAVTEISDRMPTVEIFLFLYSGLFIFLIKSIATKETFSIVINALGFLVQVILLSLIVFK